MSSDRVVQLEHASVSLFGRVILDEVSMTFRPGITAVVGLNGSGKSTLMDAIAGFRKIGSGEITFSPPDAKIGYLPQSAPLPPRVRVSDILAEVLWFRGWPRREISDRVEQVLQDWELHEFRDRRTVDLSGGTRQRLAFATVTASDPQILLLDEPTVGLDIENRRLVQSLVAGQRDRITIVTSHISTDIEPICDWIIVLDRGRKRFEGVLSDLKGDQKSLDDAIIALSGQPG